MMQRSSYMLAPWFLLVSLLCLPSCIHYPRFTLGALGGGSGCIAVLPLADAARSGDSAEGREQLLAEYLVMALKHNGVVATIGPTDIQGFVERAGSPILPSIHQEEALRYGRHLRAQSVVYGSFVKMPIQDASAPVSNPELLVGADLYLLEVGSGAIAWIYSSRFYSRQESYLPDLAKLSRDVTQSMLASAGSVRVVSKESCWDEERIVANLASEAKGGVSPVKAPPPAVVTPPKKPALQAQPQMPTLELNALSAEYLRKLQGGEALVLHNLFSKRSSSVVSGELAKIDSLGKAMVAMPPSTQFVIEGHVDETLKKNDDQLVTEQQASILRDKLAADYPILSGRLQTAAKGGTSPMMPNVNLKSRLRNRRVVVSVLPATS